VGRGGLVGRWSSDVQGSAAQLPGSGRCSTAQLPQAPALSSNFVVTCRRIPPGQVHVGCLDKVTHGAHGSLGAGHAGGGA
jgi:hypothetical protein